MLDSRYAQADRENLSNELNKQRINCANYMLTNTRTKCQNLIMQKSLHIQIFQISNRLAGPGRSPSNLPEWVGARITNVQSPDLNA